MSGKWAKLKIARTTNNMLVILPVKSLLLYLAMGMSTYSMITFLLTASPLEIQFLGVLLNFCSVGFGIYMTTVWFPQISAQLAQIGEGRECLCCEDAEDAEDEEDEEDAEDAAETYEQTDRQVVEKDGTLIITTTFRKVHSESDTDSTSTVEEVREMIEKTPPQESPTEMTTEFADLLKRN